MNVTRKALASAASVCWVLLPVSLSRAQTLEADLAALDDLRKGFDTPFDRVEEEGQKLFRKYNKPEEHAQIYFQLAHVYAQSGVQHPDRITRYAREALKHSLTPEQRGALYSYMGSAAVLDKSVSKFAERRRRAALPLLEGLKEVARLNLPEMPPELPPGEVFNVSGASPKMKAEFQRKTEEAQRARKRAAFIGEMIKIRDALTNQIAWHYSREPLATEEVRAMAEQTLQDPAAIERLMSRVSGEIKRSEQIEKERRRRLGIPDPEPAPVNQGWSPLRIVAVAGAVAGVLAVSALLLIRHRRSSVPAPVKPGGVPPKR